MNTHVPGSPEWELENCRQEFNIAWDECDKAARHYNKWRQRLSEAREALRQAATAVNSEP